jgi:hypothetical protein
MPKSTLQHNLTQLTNGEFLTSAKKCSKMHYYVILAKRFARIEKYHAKAEVFAWSICYQVCEWTKI